VHVGRSPNIQGAGTYHDEYRRTADGWRFVSRPISDVHAGFRIVDGDGHYAEPADVFDGRIDPKHLERAPRVLRIDDGRQGMSFLGSLPAAGMFGSGDAIVPGGIQNPEFRD
jgi:hypothetical protein